MAHNLPDALQLCEIKYGTKATSREQVRVAERLENAGRLAEALDLYRLAGHDEGLESMWSRAIKDGRPVLLIMLRRAGRQTAVKDWITAGDAALAAGRPREAYRCYQEAEHEEGLERVREVLPDYETFTPQGK